MRTYQKCIAEREVFTMNVPSNTKQGMFYKVKGYVERGHIECSCPAFKFGGKCKHTDLHTEECGWDESSSPEVQSLAQKDARECPRCGQRTVSAGSF
jgi:hypothetical protein